MGFPSRNLLLVIVACVLTASAINISHSQASTLNGAIQASEGAFAVLQAADEAGANVTDLAAKFNAALGLLQAAQKLASVGDTANASGLANRAQQSFNDLVPQAQKIRDDAVMGKRAQTVWQTVLIPVEALTVGLVAVSVDVANRAIKKKQFGELQIKSKGEV